MTKKKQSPKTKKIKRPSSTTPTKGNKKFKLILGLIVGFFGILLYLNTYTHGFALDDASAISDNYVTQKGFDGISTHLTKHYRFGYWNSTGVLYRPISLVMFAIEWELSPDNPSIHHLINILLYGLTGFLLLLTLTKIFKSRNISLAFLSAMFFIAHPVHTEVVANIKSRDEILLFFFALGSFYTLWKFLETKHRKWMLLSLLAYTLAIFSKENGITLLLIFPLLMYFFSSLKWKSIAQLSALYIIPSIIFLAIRVQVLGSLLGGGAKVSILDNYLSAAPDFSSKLASAILMMGKYFVVLIFPVQLGSDFGYNQIAVSHWGNWMVILSLLTILALAYFAIRYWKTKSIWAFCILFFGISFSLFSNILVTVGTAYGERFLYISSLAFSIALAYALLKFFKVDLNQKINNFKELLANKTIVFSIAGVLLCLYSFKTVDRNRAWKSSYDLYATDIVNAPNSAKLNYHLGLEQVKKGLATKDATEKNDWFNAAFKQFEKAIEIYPNYHDAYGQLGLAYFRKNDFKNAMLNYEKSVALKANNAKVYSNMGIIYFNQGNLQKAEEVYKKAIAIDPRFLDARRNLGSVFAQTKRFDLAIEQFKEALKLDENDPIINFYLGSSYQDKGDQQNAQIYLNKAYQLNPALRKN